MPEVLSAEMLQSFESSILPTDEAQTLPPEIYTSEEFFAFEKEAIFGRDWLCVGRTSQVAEPGDYFTITLLEEPLIIAKGKDGQIRAMSAVCQHRAMTVADDCGSCTTFTCPYHHWVYGLDGRLLGAPAMHLTKDFDKSDFGLPQLKVELWQGFIFVSFDADAPALAPTLSKTEELLRNYELEEGVSPYIRQYPGMPWNWKVMFENFNDGYHANKLHQGIHDFCPSENAEFTGWSDDDGCVVRTNRFIHIDGGFNPMNKAILPIFPSITEEERWRVGFALVPPNLMFGLAPDQVFYFLLNPTSAGSIDLQIGYVFHPKALEHPLFDLLFEQSESGVRIIVEQDIDATTKVQQGLRSRFAPRSRYSWQEEAQRQFNRWLVNRYKTRWPS